MAYRYGGAIRDVGTPKPSPAPAPPSPRKPRKNGSTPNPSKCGTTAGYKLHERTRTPKCQPCKDANAAYSRAYAARPKTADARHLFNPDKCGTYAGYKRHKRSTVQPCEPCHAAYTTYRSQFRGRQKAAITGAHNH